MGSIGIVQHKEHTPEVLSIPPGTPCMLPAMKYHMNGCHVEDSILLECYIVWHGS